MKRTIILFSACIIGLASCKRIAEPTVYSILTEANAFQTKADAVAAVNGIYARLKQPSGVSDSYQYYAGFQMAITDFTTDIGHSFQSGDISQLSDAQWSTNNKYINFAYQHQYKLISDANTALFNIPKIKTLTETQLNQYFSEIKFLRALAYIDLTDEFGPVILTTEENLKNPDYTTKVPPASLEVINAFLISDLESAAANLPVNYEGKAIYPTNDVGRATKGAALSLLTKLYMREHQWQKALETIQKIEDLHQYELYPTYAGLFAESNKWCKESIFSSLADALNDATELMNHFGPLNNPVVTDRWQYYAVSWSFWNSYAPNDERREMFFYDYKGTDGLQYMQAPAGQTTPPKGKYYLPDVATKKYADPAGSKTYYDGHGIPILRYADIVLCKAEALNEVNGPTQASIDLINSVKARSKATLLGAPGTYTKDSLRDKILQERGWEFFFECKRRVDLIRMGKYQEVVNTYLKSVGKPASIDIAKHKYFPYPQTQVDLNPNLSNAGRL
ncbi:RagB/SusD family nutrient uptake outer membrane protein [Pedobacter panaciterrae]|jgi:SusD family.|uniref:RagB/SusD family nutrient uptake outer membrane protein n=1 Tax=Pedobacter panaciterrae TaxID=363849 RepID=UPI00155DC64A|nr:RagB/SusD family nutrient uptake outer membrane protein [Pedobacter panaciterrae]NQX52483.1 RagB/SusD family nutrient uptake outer membrane protein [Pedobacter panaciterrae]